jgi:hypothetical protein
MAGNPAPPLPLKSSSSAPAFKSNASSSSRGHEPAKASSTSPAAAELPVPIPSDSLVAVLGVVGELSARGLLQGFTIPEAGGLTDEGASAVFDGMLTAFLAEHGVDPAAASCLPIPPPPLGDGKKVELVSLFLAVRARGGFSAVESWAAVAEAVGLDPTADTAVKLLYGKYLALLEQSCDKPLKQDHMVVSSGNADVLMGSKKERFLSPIKCLTSTAGSASAHLKRKRETLVGMLDWVHLVAKNPGKQGKNRAAGHKQAVVVELRRQMFADKDCLAREELVKTLNWVRLVAKSAGHPGIIGMNNRPDHLATAVELRSAMSLVGMLEWVRLVATSPAEPVVMEGNSLSYRSTALLFREQKFANKKCSRWSAASPQVVICCFPVLSLNASFIIDSELILHD